MNKKNQRVFPPAGVASTFGEASRDVIELMELQVELLKADADRAARWMLPGVVILVGSLLALVACFPLALTALAFFIENCGCSRPLSFAIGFLIGLAVCTGTGAIGFFWLRKSTEQFNSSKQEFQRNISWFKDRLSNGRKGNA